MQYSSLGLIFKQGKNVQFFSQSCLLLVACYWLLDYVYNDYFH